MEKTPDFVIKHTLGELLVKYTNYAKESSAAAYLCYMYAEDCGVPIDAIGGDVQCDVLDKIIELCPDLFHDGLADGTIEGSLTELAMGDFNGRDISWNAWYANMETLRKNLIKEMIRRFGDDFEFTVNVWVCDGE